MSIVSDSRPRLDAITVTANLFRRQNLHPATRATDVTRLTQDILALHATDPASVHLSVWARLHPSSLEDVQGALRRALVDHRSLVRTIAMRHTLFIVASSELAPFHAAYRDRFGAVVRRQCKRFLVAAGCCGESLADQVFDQLCAKVRRALDDGPLSVPEIARSVPELAAKLIYKPDKSYGGTKTIGGNLIDGMGILGHVIRGPVLGGWRGGQCAWARLDQWLPEMASADVDPAAGRAHVLRRYLDVFGPVTLEDAVWWSGFTKRQVRDAFDTFDDLQAATIAGWEGEHLVLAGRLDELGASVAENGPAVALLPALDPYVMGYKRRERFFHPDWTARLFDRNGNAGPMVWVDGRCLGGWAQRASGEVVFEFLAPVGKKVRLAVATEAERLSRALGEELVKPRFPTPLVKELVSEGAGGASRLSP